MLSKIFVQYETFFFFLIPQQILFLSEFRVKFIVFKKLRQLHTLKKVFFFSLWCIQKITPKITWILPVSTVLPKMSWDDNLFKEFEKLKDFFIDALQGNLQRFRKLGNMSKAISLIKQAGGLAQWYLGTCLQPLEYFCCCFFFF